MFDFSWFDVLAWHAPAFIRTKCHTLFSNKHPVVHAVEPVACPSLTKGKYCYDYGVNEIFSVLLDVLPSEIGGKRFLNRKICVAHICAVARPHAPH
jgi:predicted alternative tryptophan synthase beta-subunit